MFLIVVITPLQQKSDLMLYLLVYYFNNM